MAQGPNPKVGLRVGGDKNPNTLCEGDSLWLTNLTVDSSKTVKFYVFNWNWKSESFYKMHSDTLYNKDSVFHVYRFEDSIAYKYCTSRSKKLYISLTAVDIYNDEFELVSNITLYFRPRVRFNGPTNACVGEKLSFNSSACPSDSTSYSLKWEVENKTYSTSTIDHTFSKSGRYKVKLTISTSNPCTFIDSMVQYVQVYDIPIPEMLLKSLRKNNTYCFGKDTLALINKSKNYTSINWIITKGDSLKTRFVKGSSSSSDTAYFVALKDTIYHIKLIAFNNKCWDTTKTVTFKSIISPEVKLKTFPYCIKADEIKIINYIDSMRGLPDAYKWKFIGPQFSDSGTNIPIKFSSLKYGRYHFTFESNGICDSFVNRDSFFIVPPITQKKDSIILCDSKDAFFQLSSAFDKFPAAFGSKWSPDTLLTNGSFNPFGRKPGFYVFYINDTVSNCFKDSLTIVLIKASPQVFRDTMICVFKDSIQLKAKDKGIFKGNGIYNNVFYTAKSGVGSFKIIFETDSSLPCPYTDTFLINVTDTVRAKFDDNSPGCVSKNLKFENKSNAPVLAWYFGDNTFGKDSVIYKTYTKSGVYKVKLIAGYKNGCQDSIEKNILILNSPSIAHQYSIDSSNCDSIEVLLKITTIDSSVKYTWIIDSKSFVANQLKFRVSRKVSYISYLPYFITGSSICGNISDSGNIHIPPRFNVSIDINGPAKKCTPYNAAFKYSIYGQYDSFVVDYGNGQRSKNSLITATYLNANTTDTQYRAIITAYNNKCGPSSDTVFVVVAPNNIKPSFTVNNPGCAKTNFNFTNTSSDSILSWSFGDGKSSTQQHPVYQYSNKGLYWVTARFKAPFGCIDSLLRQLVVHDKPQLSQKYLIDSSACDSVSIKLLVTNPDSAQTYRWKVLSDTFSRDTINLKVDKRINTAYYLPYFITGSSICGNISDSGNIRIPPRFNVSIDINGPAKKCTPYNAAFKYSIYGQYDSFVVDYGNGQRSKNSLITATYLNANTTDTQYRAIITAYNNKCGPSSDTVFVVVAPNNIKPSFMVNNPGCVDSLFYFNNTSSDSIKIWEFGDGNKSLFQNPSHIYKKTGTFYIKAVYTADWGCLDTLVKEVQVIQKPIFNMKFRLDTSTCNTIKIIVEAVNSDTFSQFQWYIGSKYFSNKVKDTLTIIKDYFAYREFVSLKVDNICNSNKVTDSFDVSEGFKADIVIDGLNTGCSPFVPKLENHSSGNVSFYRVDYGNGDTSVNRIKKTHFTNNTDSTKRYTIVLSAFNQECDTLRDTTYIFVNPVLVKPIAQYSKNKYCINEQVTFINNSSPEAKVRFFWGDGTIISNVKFGDKLTHIYNNPGSYVATLEAESCGVDTSISYPLIIEKVPVANFITNTNSMCANQEITFINATDSSYTRKWRINNKDTAILRDTFHKTFSSPGFYSIEIFVESPNGLCADSSRKLIYIDEEPRLTLIPTSTIGCSPQSVCVNISGNLSYCKIDWGNGVYGDMNNTCVTYYSNDTFTAKFYGLTSNGCSIKDSLKFAIHPEAKSEYEISIDSSACDYIILSGRILNENRLLSYIWDIDSNRFDSNYFKARIYKFVKGRDIIVNLQVSNICKTKNYKDTITIGPKWLAQLGISGPSAGCSPFKPSFINHSLGMIDSFWVDYGDGNHSKNEFADKTFYNLSDTVQTHTVILKIFNQFCPASFDTVQFRVYPNKILLAAEYERDIYCLKEEIKFVNRSSPNADITFDFGDGSSVSGKFQYGDTIKHLYTLPGVYKIAVYSKSPCLGDSSSLLTVTIRNLPKIDFSISDDPICVNNQIQVYNASEPISNFYWIIDQLDTFKGVNPLIHTFNLTGVHSIQLEGYSTINDCFNSISKSVEVAPKLDYKVQLDTPICVNQTTCVHITGNVNKANINWDNKSFGSLDDTCTKYNLDGTYNLNFVLTTREGCLEQISRSIYVHPNPFVRIIPDEDYIELGVGQQISLSFDTFQEFANYRWLHNYDTICRNLDPGCDKLVVGPFPRNSKETYKLLLTDQYGCSNSDVISIQITSKEPYFIPNAFSPNRDAVNETFKPIIFDLNIESYDMLIFNRWGEIVYKSIGTNIDDLGWDGWYNGSLCEMELYGVWIKFNTKARSKEIFYKGYVMLVR